MKKTTWLTVTKHVNCVINKRYTKHHIIVKCIVLVDSLYRLLTCVKIGDMLWARLTYMIIVHYLDDGNRSQPHKLYIVTPILTLARDY